MSVWTPSNNLHLCLPIFRSVSSLAFEILFGRPNPKSSILTNHVTQPLQSSGFDIRYDYTNLIQTNVHCFILFNATFY
jgi:hypothetical protein